LEPHAASDRRAERVLLLGSRTDVSELLASSDVFVLRSLYEGTPRAVLEAMAAGRAIVSSAVGGVPEPVEDGNTALLVTPGSIDELAASLRRVLGDRNLRTALGARGNARSGGYPETMAGRVTQVYEDLLARAA
jgi:glycosyltransferase involved in cell wall biosynthesis